MCIYIYIYIPSKYYMYIYIDIYIFLKRKIKRMDQSFLKSIWRYMAEGVHVRTFGHSTAFTVPAFKNRGHVSTVIKWSMSPLGNSISACLTCYYCFETSMSNHIKLMSPSLCCSLRCCCRSKRRREMVWPDAKGDADPDCLQQQCRHQQQYDLGGQRRFC